MPKKFKSKEEASKYSALHSWLRTNFGSATTCENCGNPNGYKCEWANISGEYKRERSDFKQLCQSCHKKQDMSKVCKRGHLYEETLITRRNDKRCSICLKLERQRRNINRNLKRKRNAMDKSK